MSNAISAKPFFSSIHLGRFGLTAIGRCAGAAFRAADRFVAYSRRRQAVAHLMAMDDRQLNDLGIYRGDIAAHIDGRFGREE